MTSAAIDRTTARPRLLFMGAFDPPVGVHGGNVSACRALSTSSIGERFEFVPIDSTQRSIPPPGLARRAIYAAGRRRIVARELAAEATWFIAFAASGLSLFEKAGYGWQARRAGVPSVLWIRDGNFLRHCERPLFRAAALRALSGVSGVFCQSPRWKSFYVDDLGLDPERVWVIENWLSDPGCLELGRRRLEAGAPRGARRTLLFLGWLIRAKGVFDLLEAFAALAAGYPDVDLVFAGDGSDRAELERAVSDRGLEGRVRFEGWVDAEARNDLLAEATIFVLPSYAEGFPNVLAEAMAAGIPVVTTPVGGIPDVVRDRENGRLVPTVSPGKLSEAIGDLLSDPVAAEAMARTAWVDAERRFGVERAVDQIEAALRDLHRSRAGHPCAAS